MNKQYILLLAAIVLFVASIVSALTRTDEQEILKKAKAFMEAGPRSTAQHDRILCNHINTIAVQIDAEILNCIEMYTQGLADKHPLTTTE